MLDISGLAASQNPDGGWAYRGGSSCTEPTVLALLALAAAGKSKSRTARDGIAWLHRSQRSDGGWPPRINVDRSTWVTALVLLLPADFLEARRESAVRWLLGSSGRETSWTERVRFLLTTGKAKQVDGAGFPWFAETAAWVTPTCFGLLALEKASRLTGSPEIHARRDEANEYLMAHTCRDGGWNHGSTRALGYDLDSYPETTGLALLALHNTPMPKLDRAMARAQIQIQQCRSLDAVSWLRLGLLAHGQNPADCPQPKGHGSVSEISLGILADAASGGRNVFLD